MLVCHDACFSYSVMLVKSAGLFASRCVSACVFIVHSNVLQIPCPLLAQTAEMQKTLGELKEAIGTLEKGKAAAVEAPPDTVTLAQLRSELRVLATSLNECAPHSVAHTPLYCSDTGPVLVVHRNPCRHTWLIVCKSQ